MKLPELLAPAGDFEKLVTALHYGAEAVYMGLSGLSLRAKADNFTEKELKAAASFVRQNGKKLYITINIFPHNRDLSLIKEHLVFVKELAPDALIVSDLGVFDIVSEALPGTPVHISTQANITNYSTAKFWEKAGAKRLVLSRELTIDEIKEIRDHVSLELECFVHGAICISYSGRCYISSFLANRSANRGECTNSCRWNYALMEEKRPGIYRPVYENEKGTYVMSSRDLCMIQHLDKLADAGVDSFKIEGRTKGINYVAGVVKTYREAVDRLQERPYKVSQQWMRDLAMSSNRGFTTGMFLGDHPDEGYNHDDETAYVMTHEFVGVVKAINDGKAEIALRNKIEMGDEIEFLSTGLEGRSFKVNEMVDLKGSPVVSGKNGEIVIIPAVSGVRGNDLVRRPLSTSEVIG
ncbi:MAG TPA: U32 family peptidase [Nitrospirae bacterium]|nr:putative protease YhbU precursor [bacterium BMS3Bbin09]HDO67261.1 U32 family peptidase [Nitrospirota bacterium]HEW81435.1 U32 family peptidase [Nitrospirota bacterium]